MNVEEIFAAVAMALVGGSGVVGLAMTYLRRYIDRKLEAGEEEAARRLAHRKRRQQVEDQLKPPPNGELAEAMENLQRAEEAKKKLDREILAEYEEE